MAALDRVSRGRAGWWIEAPGADDTEESGLVKTCHVGSGVPRMPRVLGSRHSGLRRGFAPPQGQPVRIVDATEEESRGAAARYAVWHSCGSPTRPTPTPYGRSCGTGRPGPGGTPASCGCW